MRTLWAIGGWLVVVGGCAAPVDETASPIEFEPAEPVPTDPPVDLAPGLPGDMCGDVRAVSRVFFGTSTPSFLPLTASQTLAIGQVRIPGSICSGLLVTATWVLTAAHCVEGLTPDEVEFRMGPDPDHPNTRIDARRIVVHETGDLALIELGSDAALLGGAVPIRLLSDDLDETWIGRTAEASGYGQDETGDLGTRAFTAEPISAVLPDLVEINGQGERGVCFGDSGGPLLVLASDGTVRVAGALSGGEGSCVGRDRFTRVDVYRTWLTRHIGGIASSDGLGCGGVSSQGRCMDGNAVWCEGDAVRNEACGDGFACAWDGSSSGYRCVAETADSCAGLDAAGACDGSVARWCDRGVVRTRDCGACGQTCGLSGEFGGVYCVDVNPCADVNYQGRCDGDIVEWCEDGELKRRDCGSFDQSCGFIDEHTGYFCR